MALTEASPHAGSRPRIAPRRVLGDEQLARLAAGGDAKAFEQIFARYHQELYRYCRTIVGNRDDAEDALQGAMAAALRSLPGEERQIALRPWLYRVAHNEAISIVRRRRPTADPADLPEEAGEGVDAKAESRQRLRQLVDDLRSLPDRQRSALVMRELSGLDYAEIGGAIDASEAAARQTVYEARVALAEIEEGREMDCEQARAAISNRDGRMLRGRRIRAHLRQCEPCRDFHAAISRRRADLEALCPPLPALAASGILASVLAGPGGGGSAGVIGGGGAAGATGASIAAGSAGSGGAAGALGASAAVKAASIVAAAAVGVGAAGATGIVHLPLVSHSGGSPQTTIGDSSPHRAAGSGTPASSAASASRANTSRAAGAPSTRTHAHRTSAGRSTGTSSRAHRQGGGGPGASAAAPGASAQSAPSPPGRAVGHDHSSSPAGGSSSTSSAPGSANGIAHRSASSHAGGNSSLSSQGASATGIPPGQAKPKPQPNPAPAPPSTGTGLGNGNGAGNGSGGGGSDHGASPPGQGNKPAGF